MNKPDAVRVGQVWKLYGDLWEVTNVNPAISTDEYGSCEIVLVKSSYDEVKVPLSYRISTLFRSSTWKLVKDPPPPELEGVDGWW